MVVGRTGWEVAGQGRGWLWGGWDGGGRREDRMGVAGRRGGRGQRGGGRSEDRVDGGRVGWS